MEKKTAWEKVIESGMNGNILILGDLNYPDYVKVMSQIGNTSKIMTKKEAYEIYGFLSLKQDGNEQRR